MCECRDSGSENRCKWNGRILVPTANEQSLSLSSISDSGMLVDDVMLDG